MNQTHTNPTKATFLTEFSMDMENFSTEMEITLMGNSIKAFGMGKVVSGQGIGHIRGHGKMD